MNVKTYETLEIKDAAQFKKTPECIMDMFKDLGTPANLLGYNYLNTAVQIAVRYPESVHAVTKFLYPTVASIYGTTRARVERAIRHAIDVTFERGNLVTLQELFGYSIDHSKGKATNSEFIATLAIRLQDKLTVD